MMQHVAISKSEVAAFATDTGSSSFTNPQSNEQFGKLLQDQKSIHALTVSSERAHHTSRKNVLKHSTDEARNVPSSSVREDTITSPITTPIESKKTFDTQPSGLSKDKTAMQFAIETRSTDDSELEVANSNAELVDGSTSIVAQEWVSLVDNLQKLADLDGAAADLTLPVRLEKSQLEPVVNNNMLDKEKVELSISMLVDQAVAKAITNLETEGLTHTDVQQKTSEILLKKPELLQDLISQLHVVSQETGIENQKNLDIAIDNATTKDSLLANQQIAMGGQADLTSIENKSLLRALLIDSDPDKTLAQLPDKSVKSDLPSQPVEPAQPQQAETLITKLESVALQGELLEQDVQMVQAVPGNSLNSNKTEKVTGNSSDIKNILNLTGDKLDKVLENIAQRVFESTKADEAVSPEQIIQQVGIPKVADIISSVGSQSKDFISSLKSGLEEYKNQLSQGREPGIDLKALVSDALAKTSDTATTANVPANLEQMLKNVAQVLDFAQTMNRSIEHHSDQAYSATLKDVAQIQGEQSKQIQLNQFESKFDKAINIAKPEGHQLLAEKVRWMVNTKNLVAEIRLDPAELGSMNVKVAMSGESATINFVVQSQQARDAIDNATPRLREMLAEKGIELGQSSVREESDGQQGQQGDGELAKQGGRGSAEAEDIDGPEQVLAQQHIVNGALGGIDYFV